MISPYPRPPSFLSFSSSLLPYLSSSYPRTLFRSHAGCCPVFSFPTRLFIFSPPFYPSLVVWKPVLLSNFIQVLHLVTLPLFSLSYSLQFLPLFFFSCSWSISLSLISLPRSLCAHTNINIISFALSALFPFHTQAPFLSFFLSIFLSFFLPSDPSFLSDHPHAYFPFSSLIGRAPYLSS